MSREPGPQVSKTGTHYLSPFDRGEKPFTSFKSFVLQFHCVLIYLPRHSYLLGEVCLHGSLPTTLQIIRGNPRFLSVDIAGELKTSFPGAPSPLIALPSLTLLEVMAGGVQFPGFS